MRSQAHSNLSIASLSAPGRLHWRPTELQEGQDASKNVRSHRGALAYGTFKGLLCLGRPMMRNDIMLLL